MAAHRFWGLRVEAKSGYSFPIPSTKTLQIREIGLLDTSGQEALVYGLNVVATTTIDVNDIYPPSDNPLDINDPWYNALTPLNPNAVNDSSYNTYCAFPSSGGYLNISGALLVDFGYYEVRDIATVNIAFGEVSDIVAGYYQISFIYSDDGLTWYNSGYVTPIGSVSDTTQSYPNNSTTIGVFTGGSDGVEEEAGPATISLSPEKLTLKNPSRLAVGFLTSPHRYWAVDLFFPPAGDGVSRARFGELEFLSATCGQNVADQAQEFDFGTYTSFSADSEIFYPERLFDGVVPTTFASNSDFAILSKYNGNIHVDFGAGNEKSISQIRLHIMLKTQVINIASFFGYEFTVSLLYSDTATGPFFEAEHNPDWTRVIPAQTFTVPNGEGEVLDGYEDWWYTSPITGYHSYFVINTLTTAWDDAGFCCNPSHLFLQDGQLSIVAPMPVVVSLSQDTLEIVSTSLLVEYRSFPAIPESFIITDDQLPISPYRLELVPQTIDISDDIVNIAIRYEGLISEVLNTLIAHVESKHKTAFLYELVYTLVNVIDDYILYVIDTISADSDLSVDTNVSITIEELINVDSLIKISFLIAIFDTLNIIQSESLLKEGYRTVDESLQINEEVLNSLLGTNTLSDFISLDSFANNPFIALIAEAVSADSSFLSKLIAGALATDDIIIDESLVQYKLNNLTLAEQASILSTLDSTAILNIVLSDYISFTMEDDDGREYTYYGWTYAPENHAVTNYDLNFPEVSNYQDNTYLANSSGLYMLGGTQDESSYIESRITTAGLQFGARTEKQIPQVFLGLGGDNHIVTVSVDENQTAYYEMKGNPDDGLATKTLKIGKGLIGNTWQFSIIDVDQLDFDLDSLEFYPVYLTRKHKK